MVEISWLGVGMGASLTLIAVAMHYARGTGWAAGTDITDAVLETRAASVPEVAFPEPMNRSIGGGAVPIEAGGGESAAMDEAEPAASSSSSLYSSPLASWAWVPLRCYQVWLTIGECRPGRDSYLYLAR